MKIQGGTKLSPSDTNGRKYKTQHICKYTVNVQHMCVYQYYIYIHIAQLNSYTHSMHNV